MPAGQIVLLPGFVRTQVLPSHTPPTQSVEQFPEPKPEPEPEPEPEPASR
jgi:hypothetical protein